MENRRAQLTRDFSFLRRDQMSNFYSYLEDQGYHWRFDGTGSSSVRGIYQIVNIWDDTTLDFPHIATLRNFESNRRELLIYNAPESQRFQDVLDAYDPPEVQF